GVEVAQRLVELDLRRCLRARCAQAVTDGAAVRLIGRVEVELCLRERWEEQQGERGEPARHGGRECPPRSRGLQANAGQTAFAAWDPSATRRRRRGGRWGGPRCSKA